MKSQLSSLILFGFLIVTMLFLMPLFHDLPGGGAGGDRHRRRRPSGRPQGALRRLRRTDRTDFVLAILCFAGVLVFGLLVGLAIAVVVSLLALVYRAYRPSFAVLGRMPGAVDDERLRYRGIEDHPNSETFPGLVILRIDGELFFANARWFRDTVRSLVRDQTPPVRELLVHVGAVPHLDTTAATMLKELIGELREADIELAFARATTGLVHDMERNGIVELVGEDRFFDTVAAGVDDFLHAAQAWSAKDLRGDDPRSALRRRAAGPPRPLIHARRSRLTLYMRWSARASSSSISPSSAWLATMEPKLTESS